MTRLYSEYTVLHVEDLEDNRGLVRQLIARVGARLLEAVDGEEGVRLARREKPDLILMDLSLPVLDGWQATTLLKADPETKGIPIVALTAHAMAGDEQRARQAGCDDYMAKPIDPEKLQTLLREYLRGAPRR